MIHIKQYNTCLAQWEELDGGGLGLKRLLTAGADQPRGASHPGHPAGEGSYSRWLGSSLSSTVSPTIQRSLR